MKGRCLVVTCFFSVLLTQLCVATSVVELSGETPNQVIGELRPPEVAIIEENETGVTLRVDFFGFQRTQFENDSWLLDVLTVPGCGLADEIGKPALSRYGVVLNVPFDVDFNVYVLEAESTNYSSYLVYPAQEPAPDLNDGFDFPTPPFYIDEDFYGAFDDWYPIEIVQYETAGTLRDVRILPLAFFAFQHNPVSRTLRFYWSITVRIDYVGTIMLGPGLDGTRLATSEETSPYFKSFYSSLLGFELTEQEAGTQEEVSQNSGCDFLIVTDSALLGAANTLAVRRDTEGLSTHVVTTNDIPNGTSAVNIKAYIQNAYDTWIPRPSYLLLLGDAELVPTFYETVHPYSNYPANTLIGTDLYYAILNGPESPPGPHYSEYWTPDIYCGRIPVDNLAQASLVIDKIIEYEDRQWNKMPSLALVAGYFQDYDAPYGFEDRRFILTLEEIRDYLLGEDFQVERLYDTGVWSNGTAVNPLYYNDGYYDAGEPLPSDLRRPMYDWDASTVDVTNAINDGRFVVFHRDHGGSANGGHGDGWGHPYYLATNVGSLSNMDHFTVVFSINCETGWFDGETDTFVVSYESLSEAFLRESDGGAVGVVGATRISYSGHNDAMAKGFVDTIWPNFDPGRGPTGKLRMGDVLNFGKLYYQTFYPDSLYRKIEYEMFHYFGDPTMTFKIPPRSYVFPIDWNGQTYNVTMISNSTISDFNFSQPDMQISFNATGPADKTCYCNVTVPKNLLQGSPWTVLLNGTDWAPSSTVTENDTCSFIYLNYTCSTHKIEIIGTWVVYEFPSFIILPLFIMATLATVIIYKKRRST